MNIKDYEYVNIVEVTGNIEKGVEEFLLKNNKPKTFQHVKSVASTNSRIAEAYGLDKRSCVLSGYLHDIAAVIRPNDMLKYMEENHLFVDEAEKKYPFILHQRISRLLAKEFFNIQDETILSAIECHSTLKSNPSDYDMALFIADKLSWDQEGKPPFYDIVREALSVSLEKACLSYINYVMNNGMILQPHSWLVEARKYLQNF
ncbi:bis(5'-nucleosyl)-tetraphosphatase (symmetrical) YqeK [Clostridium sp. 19966]|uniref:bis(5'-nucleosyl)-tetraphosphatase (symmetrical) YqeK n=1 Tax=Clostridium sp. 19966 TaxID=2768166 RepID=UPI0028DFC137|nr:bis(5'-nucleosyl)-tetraphosphatase (symmetrical) YqeK [Clostridium sp. 19966]MDT8717658.1 bis(5'-nucleosyl)-tetraphosphatase (symmetrical) YqeK [Clostridium sp. 19966]